MFQYHGEPNSFNDRTILITGAGDGIGAAVAAHFASLGATVILLGKTFKKLEAVANKIVQAGGKEPALYVMNLAKATPDDFKLMAERIGEQFGQLDGLLHNAAYFSHLAPIEHTNVKDWHEIMQVNVNAVFMLTQASLDLLKKSPVASIVFTVSNQSFNPKAFWGAHTVSKCATLGLMKVLAAELENSNIRVNAINPGRVATSMRSKAYPDEDRSKLASTDDVLPGYAYLMGNDARELHGVCFDVTQNNITENLKNT